MRICCCRPVGIGRCFCGFTHPVRDNFRGRFGELTQAGRDGIRHPHPELLLIADPRPLLDEAARVAARYGGGWLVAETLAMGLHHGRALWFGAERNVGRILHAAADELGIVLNIAT